MTSLQPRLNRWTSTLADPEQERQFRANTALLERVTVLIAVIVVVGVYAATLAFDSLGRNVEINVWDVVGVAVAVTVALTALVAMSERARARWGSSGVAIIMGLELLLALLMATAPSMQTRATPLMVAIVLLIYLAMRFNLVQVTAMAVTYTALMLPSWLYAMHARPDSAAEIWFTCALLVVSHTAGFTEARRVQRERRIVFVQQRTLRTLSIQDDLTQLDNRRRFYEIADMHLPVEAGDNSLFAVVLVDLDRFKEINDTLGHQAGDRLLQEVAVRLRHALPQALSLARLGGDEYIALLRTTGSADALQQTQQFAAALEKPISVDGLAVYVRASIGVALSGAAANSRSALLRRADVAMYQAKERSSGIQLYALETDPHSRDQVELTSDLAAALDTDQIVLFYQPKADATTGEVTSVEALIRWQHPLQGLLPPADFLPLAEQQGMMNKVTLRVLDIAMRQASRWATQGRPLHIAVNIAAANLLDARFPGHVSALLLEHDLPASALQLEITEDTFLVDPERIFSVLSELQGLGFTFSLDDYGTGYSSLSHLRSLPIRELKIDRSFVSNIVSSEQDAVIVQSTTEMARRLGFTVVAEGVEDAATWAMLTDFGCDAIQGYYLSRPIAPDDFDRWFEQYQPAAMMQALS